MDTDDERIEVKFNEKRGILHLICSRPAFTRLLRILREEGSLNKSREIPYEDVSFIWISASAPPSTRPSWLADRIALIGCGVVGFIAASIFMIGFLALAGYLHPPH